MNWTKWLKPHVVLLLGLAGIVIFRVMRGGFTADTTVFQLFVIGASIGAGFTLGWLCTPKAKAAREWALTAAALVLAYFTLGNPLGGWAVVSAIAVSGFWVSLFYVIGSAMRGIARNLTERPTTFGSAEWATATDLEKAGLVGTDGLRLGVFTTPEKTLPLQYTSDRHLATFATTRGGKGVSTIIPNLLTARQSVVVVDPKAENALITAEHRASMGHEVFVLDPWRIAGGKFTAKFNPLDWLDAGDIDVTENAYLLADALVVPSGKGDAFWDEEAKSLLAGFLLYVATSKYEEGQRTLPRVRDLLLYDGSDMKLLFQRMLDSDHHLVRATGARSLQKDGKLLSSVVSVAQSNTAFLDSPRIRESMSSSDFKFEDLKTKAMSIYLVLPADRLSSFNRWLRLLLQQALTVNARNIRVKPRKPVLFILDEMTSLGPLQAVEQGFSLLAGFGIQIWIICQDLGRLKKTYGEDISNSFIANCGVVQYYGTRDPLTADFMSSLCGVTTVWNFSSALARAFSKNSGPNGSTSMSDSTTTTESMNVTQRKLVFPDELMRTPPTRQLLLVEHNRPIMATKIRWFDDPILKRLGRNLHKS